MSARPSYRPYRLEVSGDIKLDGAFHIGTGEDFHSSSDSPLLRTSNASGAPPYLPGSSLRGRLRAHLEREYPLLGCSSHDVLSLFGDAGETSSFLGRLEVRDAWPAEDCAIEIRDHVRLDTDTGAAAYGGKFDVEVGSCTATFRFSLAYEGEGPDDAELCLLHEAIRLLTSGTLQVGAKKAWGLGRVQLLPETLSVLEFDRRTNTGLQSYLQWRLTHAIVSAQPKTSIPSPPLRPALRAPQAWNTLTLDLALQFEGPVLVKHAIPPQHLDPLPDRTTALFDPDDYWRTASHSSEATFVTSAAFGGLYYLPGSSLRGVLRHEANWIAGEDPNLQRQVQELFGFAKGNSGGYAGRLRIFDGTLPKGIAPRLIALDHVAIDRIAGAAADGKKFDAVALESPLFLTTIQVQIESAQTPLLVWVRALWRQLAAGRLWVGSGSSRGYGLLAQAWLRSGELDVPLDSPLAKVQLHRTDPPPRPGRAHFAISQESQLSQLWEAVEQ